MAVISGEALRMGSFTAGYLHLSASGLQHWSGRGQGRALRRARTSLDRIPANAVFEIEEGEGTSCTRKLARLRLRSSSSQAHLLLSSGPCLGQNQTFICGLRRFRHHRRVSLDLSAGLETIGCEALELLPCPAKVGRGPADRAALIDLAIRHLGLAEGGGQ